MRKATIILTALAAVALGALADQYINANTVKIDEDVTLVTLGNEVMVLKRGEIPRVTRVRQPANRGKPSTPKPNAPLAWTLPYSCSDVRYYNSHFTRTQLEAMRVAAGMRLPTPAERVQIQACLAGRIT
jgi:hypothetical protein